MAAGAGGPTGLEHPRWFCHHMSTALVLVLWLLSPHVISSSWSFLCSKVIGLLHDGWLPRAQSKKVLGLIKASA